MAKARQYTFSDLEYDASGRRTRKSDFLDKLDELVPWDAWVEIVRGVYDDSEGRRGRPAIGAEVMLRVYLVQICFNLSDLATEEAIVDSRAIGDFVGRGVEAPDATTLCRFRHALEEGGVGQKLLGSLQSVLAERGVEVSRGTIVDATFIESPSSTKNASHSRDPEAHQAKKGNNWHFGYKAHVGVDAGTGVPHTLVTTAANAADVNEGPGLLRPGDEEAWADAGYLGVESREGAGAVEWHVAARQSQVTDETRASERLKASVRSRVEHVFHVVKDRFGIRKTRYRGLAKNDNLLAAAVAVAGLVISESGPCRLGPPEVLSAESMAKANERAARREAERQRKKAERAERAAAKGGRKAATATA